MTLNPTLRPCSPTILAAEAGKLAITVALGFDSYLVMRHGVRKTQAAASASTVGGSAATAPPVALGCYFCGDVVGPLNSTLNRTLDQQCTVTRPGCAPIASAMAVELFVSILHHPLEVRLCCLYESICLLNTTNYR